MLPSESAPVGAGRDRHDGPNAGPGRAAALHTRVAALLARSDLLCARAQQGLIDVEMRLTVTRLALVHRQRRQLVLGSSRPLTTEIVEELLGPPVPADSRPDRRALPEPSVDHPRSAEKG